MSETKRRLHSVSLELLRHGPPHNQLLSRLTQYLALCGNWGAESIQLPMDHAEQLLRLDALSYGQSDTLRTGTLHEVGLRIAHMLAAIPGLGPSLSQATDSKADLAHLRLVLNAHELAMIPFECTLVPAGSPGTSGEPLLLQPAAPVTLTREIRGVSGAGTPWPLEPRILFAWAAPNGIGSVPYEAHLAALREAVDPWISAGSSSDRASVNSGAPMSDEAVRVERMKSLVTVLPMASLSEIHRLCSQSYFTHIHILAHGVVRSNGLGQEEVGLALHHAQSGFEIVSGQQLSNALKFTTESSVGRPAVITLAACRGSEVRSVITHGASIAHALHGAGIPFVVASQFPLSKRGSIIFTRDFYSAILRAQDPRRAIHAVRRRLASECTNTHDWASLVAYAALPPDFEDQLEEVLHKTRVESARRLFGWISLGISRLQGRVQGDQAASDQDLHRDAVSPIEQSIKQVEAYARAIGDYRKDFVEGAGMKGALLKRKAEAHYWISRALDRVDGHRSSLDGRTRHERLSREALQEARRAYWEVVEISPSNHWPTTQFLCLSWALDCLEEREYSLDADLWTTAKKSAEIYHEYGIEVERMWAASSLLELYLIHYIVNGDESFADQACDWMAKYVADPKIQQIAIFSTRDQLNRYISWWAAGNQLEGPGRAKRLGERLSRMLPPA